MTQAFIPVNECDSVHSDILSFRKQLHYQMWFKSASFFVLSVSSNIIIITIITTY